VIRNEFEVAIEGNRDLENCIERRVPAGIGQQTADDLGLHRHAARELRLRDTAALSGTLERANERVRVSDLGTCDLKLLAER
jgi:hypothetical protein